MSKQPEPTYHLRLRSYPEQRFVSVWLVRRTGPADSALLFGEVLPSLAGELVAALGLPVESEDSPLTGFTPITPLGCLPVAAVERSAEQVSLFSEEP